MTDPERDPEAEYMDAIAGDPGPAELSPEEQYIRRVRAGESPEQGAAQETQQSTEQARGEDGRFAATEEPEEAAEEETQIPTGLEFADAWMGHEATDEELEERAVEEHWEALRSGDAIEEIVEEQQIYADRIESLKKVHPHIDSKASTDALADPLKQIAEEYGPETAYSPVVIARTYEQLGGEERFAPDPDVESWERAASGPPTGSRFTR